MSCTTSVNQVEMMHSPNPLVLHAGLAGNSIRGSFDVPSIAAERTLARGTLCELLRSVGKDPKLVAALAATKSGKERVDLLIHSRFIESGDDLPTEKEVKEQMKCWFACSAKREEAMQPITPACSVIFFGGSYEDS